jgi:hypothetical protein
VTGAQCFPTAPIPDPTEYAENSRSPPEDYTKAISGSTSVVPDPLAWPAPRGPIDFAHPSSNDFPPWVPALEYRLTEYRGLYINHLDPFSVESARRAVGSRTHPGSGAIGAQVKPHPPTHVTGRGEYEMHCNGEGGEVALSNGEMNRAV